MILTKKEFEYIKKQRVGQQFLLKVDFGLREVKAVRWKEKVVFDEGLFFNAREKIKDKYCYLVNREGVKEVAFFSSQTNRFYKLMPTNDWPTISISSVPMHRRLSPRQDTQNKIDLIKPYGGVLDTCMGLGYTAIMASKTARTVITCEADENVVFMAGINPLSEELFSSSNIEIREFDVSLEIKKFDAGYFDCIIHDPPTFKMAPQLYTVNFYKDLFAVLKEGGKLFHYTPLYKVKAGFDFPSRIEKKLKAAGFKVDKFSKEACGFLCRR
jgi:predicted methyltransferase